jgi:hypothetical protein
MDKPYIIIDDILPQEIADDIENLLLNEVNWKFISDITYAGANQNTPAMSHVFANIEWPGYNCALLSRVQPIIDYGTKSINYEFCTLLKARSFLQLPLHENYSNVQLDTLHVDQPFPHLVLLYYVIDAEGETIIVNKTIEEKHTMESFNANDYEEIGRIKPKKNRLVVFDGRYYHTAEQPRAGLRCIINFNLLGAFK